MLKMHKYFDAPVVEPKNRLVGGRFGRAVHRFPIRGGISLREALERDLLESMSKPNPLFALLEKRSPK